MHNLKNLLAFVSYFLIVLLISGCSTHYVRSEGTSKKAFLNNTISDLSGKTIKVTLLNDSTITADEFLQSEDDLILKYPSFSKIKKIKPTDAANINYQKHTPNNLSAVIELKDGRFIEAYYIKFTTDTIFYLEKETAQLSVPVDSIKYISCSNKFHGALKGFLLGAGASGISAAILNRNPDGMGFAITIFSASIGGLAGGLTGLLIGEDDVYIFHR